MSWISHVPFSTFTLFQCVCYSLFQSVAAYIRTIKWIEREKEEAREQVRNKVVEEGTFQKLNFVSLLNRKSTWKTFSTIFSVYGSAKRRYAKGRQGWVEVRKTNYLIWTNFICTKLWACSGSFAFINVNACGVPFQFKAVCVFLKSKKMVTMWEQTNKECLWHTRCYAIQSYSYFISSLRFFWKVEWNGSFFILFVSFMSVCCCCLFSTQLQFNFKDQKHQKRNIEQKRTNLIQTYPGRQSQ